MRFVVRAWAAAGMLLAATSARADLVAYYNFDGEVEDSSGLGNNPSTILHGTFHNDVPSQIGAGTSFNMEGGTGGFIVPDSPSLDMTDGLTISTWVNMSDRATYYFIAAKNPSGTAGINYPGNFELRINPSGFMEFLHQTTEGQTLGIYGSTTEVPPLEWHHVAVTARAGGAVQFFVDGAAAGSATLAAFPVLNDNPLYVGTRADNFSYFLGWMDDLALWNEPLKSVQIASLAEGTSPTNLPEFDPFDINFDEVVDLLDYGIIRDNFGTGTTFEQGDVDGNGRVDGFDFRAIKTRLSQEGITVPEPASVLLLSLSAGVVILARRSRKLAGVAATIGLCGCLAATANAQLELTVNPYTGDTSLTNKTGAPFDLDNYSITSGSASLDPDAWSGFAENGVAGWEAANPRSRQLSELQYPGTTTLANNQTVQLGQAFRPQGYRDLALAVVPLEGSELAPATVSYVGAPAAGTEYRLPNVTIAEVSSQLGAPFERAATHVIDGSGMDFGAGTHTIAPDGFMWLTNGVGFLGGTDVSPFIVFDLGDEVNLTDVKIWNYNEDLPGRPELLGRGVDQFEISVGTDLGALNSLGNFSLDKAPGLGDVDFSEVISLDENGVRYVRFDILSNHNLVQYPAVGGEPDAAFAGLSEVQFFALAASGPLGDTNGDGVVDIVDLNNVRNNFGASGLGDTNNDGTVDITDLNNVRNNFGAVAGSAVPEPASLLLALCAGVSALASRRRLA